MNDLVFPLPLESLRRRLLETAPEFVELLQRFSPLRQEMQRKKSELQRVEFAQRLEQSDTTRAIREAAWTAAAKPHGAGDEWIDFESDPELSLRYTLNLYQRGMTATEKLVRTRSLYHEEREILHRGRPVPGFVLNLAFLGDAHVLVVPKIETQAEARALAELLYFWSRRTGRKPRIGIEFETVRGVVEAEEILFELKDFLVAMTFDPVDYLCNLIRKLSGQRDFLINPFREEQRFGLLAPLQGHLRATAEKRGVGWVGHPGAEGLSAELHGRPFYFPKIPEFRSPSEEEVRALIRESLEYLVDVVASAEAPERAPDSGRYSRFELARSLLWQWIHHEAISEDLYYRLRDAETARMSDSRLETGTQLLDSLLLNGNFVEFLGTRTA